MKRLGIIIALVSILISGNLLLGCTSIREITDSGPVISRDFDLADFTHVQVSNAFEIELIPSETYSVSITASENIFPHINVSKSGNTLTLGVKDVNINIGGLTLKAKVTMPELWKLELSGASRGEAQGFKSSHDFDLLLSGASTFDMDMETDSVDFKISGASEVTGHLEASDTRVELSGASILDIEGSAENTILQASGASEADLYNFTVNDADIELSGASDATIYINGRLDINLSGGSSLEFGGNPTLGDFNISGGSTLNNID